MAEGMFPSVGGNSTCGAFGLVLGLGASGTFCPVSLAMPASKLCFAHSKTSAIGVLPAARIF